MTCLGKKQINAQECSKALRTIPLLHADPNPNLTEKGCSFSCPYEERMGVPERLLGLSRTPWVKE